MKLRTLIMGIALSGLISCGISSIAHASDLEYIWNGNEGVVGYGGPYEEMATARADEDLDPVGANYVLNNNSVGAQTYGNRALGLTLTMKMTAQPDARCQITAATIRVQNNKVTETIANEVHEVNGNWTSFAVFDSDCKRAFNGAFLGGDGVTQIYNKDIKGERGQNPIIYRFEEQLRNQAPREKKHYIARACSQSKPDSACKEAAEKSYDIAWDTCRYNTYSKGFLTEDSVGVPPSENAGANVTDAFSKCVKKYSGLGINESILRYKTALDIVEYSKKTDCTVEYIGYIVCPASRFMAKILDAAFNAFSNFFEIAPLDRGTQAGDLLYRTWAVMRNIANALFAIFFIVIVLSQVSNIGISNYGIKKLLPRLIAVAVLVNISYYLCVAAIDFSNILGLGVKNVLDLMKPTVTLGYDSWSKQVNTLLTATVLATGVGIVLVTASLVALFPLLVGAAISLIVAVILMLARVAIILGLTIVSPLALACLLLPNTKSWYNKWKDLFVSMLMLYPLVSLVFGASTIAGLIIMNSSISDNAAGSVSLQLFGLAVQMIPLAITPLLLRIGGGVLGQIGGTAAKSGIFNNARKKSDQFVTRRKNARDLRAIKATGNKRRKGLSGVRDRVVRRRYLRKGIQSKRESEYHTARSDYISGYTSGTTGYGGDKKTKLGFGKTTRGEKFAGKLGAGAGDAKLAISNAENVQAHLLSEEAQAAKLTLRHYDQPQLTNLASDPNTSQVIRQAAIELVKERGTPLDINQLVKSSGKGTTRAQRQLIASAAASASPLYSTPEAQQSIIEGKIQDQQSFTQNIVSPALTNGTLSAKSLGESDVSTLQEVQYAVDNGHVDTAAAQNIRNLAHEAYTNPKNNSGGYASAASREGLRRLSGR